MLWAGGFRPDFGWIDIAVFDELGFPRAERGVTGVPGSASSDFRGCTHASPLLLGVGEDAAHVAGAVAAYLWPI